MIVIQSVYWDQIKRPVTDYTYGAFNFRAAVDGLEILLAVTGEDSESMDWRYAVIDHDTDVHGLVTSAHARPEAVAEELASAFRRDLLPGMLNGPTYAPAAITAV